MWGPGQKAPLLFRINPRNHSGKKLHRICEGHQFVVTNASSEIGSHASDHRNPDREFLRKAIHSHPWNLIIACGNVAQPEFLEIRNESVGKTDFAHELLQRTPYILMPHPASRSLTNQLLDDVRTAINTVPLRSLRFYQQRGNPYSLIEFL